MCFGGGDTSQTVTQVPAQKTPEEQEAIKLALESMRMRNWLVPYLLQEGGFTLTPEGSEWPIAKLPPTENQQQLNTLTSSSLGGANEAAQMISSRLRNAQGMIPGLMASVQASMAPGTQSALSPMGQGAGLMEGLGQIRGMSQPPMANMSGGPTGALPPMTPGSGAPPPPSAGGLPGAIPGQMSGGLSPQMMQVLMRLLQQQAMTG